MLRRCLGGREGSGWFPGIDCEDEQIRLEREFM